MTIAQEEIFGPVLSIIPYEDEEDAIRIANGTLYGLAGGVQSASQERAEAVARACGPARSTSTAARTTSWRRSAASVSRAVAGNGVTGSRSFSRSSRSSAELVGPPAVDGGS